MKWNKINESYNNNDISSLYKLMYDDVSKIITDVRDNPSKYGIDELSEDFYLIIRNITNELNALRDCIERKESDYLMMDSIRSDISMDIAVGMGDEISDEEVKFLGELDSVMSFNILKYKTTRNRLPKPKHKYTYTIGFWHYDEEQGEILAKDEKEARQLIINEYQDDDRHDYKEYKIVDIKPR